MQVESITEQLFFTTVRIDTESSDEVVGSGTGFIFSYARDGQRYPFIVTSKHVVDGTTGGKLTFHKGKDNKVNLGEGFALEIEEWDGVWLGHPDVNIDIAVCPLSPFKKYAEDKTGYEIFLRSVPLERIPSPSQEEELDAIESVTFIGYPNGIWDEKNLLPVARRGTTASPIEVDFEGEPKFLIDASVFRGSSGSPVFILDRGSWESKTRGTVMGERFYFVGVVSGVFGITQFHEVVQSTTPVGSSTSTVRQVEMIDLGVVFKARTVVETIELYLEGIS